MCLYVTRCTTVHRDFKFILLRIVRAPMISQGHRIILQIVLRAICNIDNQSLYKTANTATHYL